jgi:hypothetical protein
MRRNVREILREYYFQREGDLERAPLEFIALDQAITTADIENTFIVNLEKRMSIRKNLEGGKDGREE